jgi:hypothetical protein
MKIPMEFVPPRASKDPNEPETLADLYEQREVLNQKFSELSKARREYGENTTLKPLEAGERRDFGFLEQTQEAQAGLKEVDEKDCRA